LDNEAAERPLCSKDTICCLNSGVYRTVFLDIVNSSETYIEVSTKPGQLQSWPPGLLILFLANRKRLYVPGGTAN
jgi:hypothetical protein